MARDKKSNKSKRKRGKKFRVFEQNVKQDAAIQGKTLTLTSTYPHYLISNKNLSQKD